MKYTVLIALATVMLVGCGPKLPPNTSPEAKTAVRATQVVAGLRGVLPVIKSMTCTSMRPEPCLSPTMAITMLDEMDKANQAAGELAKVLAVVDAATTVDAKTTGMQKARDYMTTIQQMMMAVSVTPSQEPLRMQLAQTFNGISALLFAIQ